MQRQQEVIDIKRSISVEATVFFLLMISLAIVGNMILGKTVIGIGEVAPIVLYVIFAFFCWRKTRIAFLIVPFGVAGGAIITYLFSYQSAPAESWAVSLHLLVIFFSIRAYRELRLQAKSKSLVEGAKIPTS